MPERVQWAEKVHEVEYATQGGALILTACGRSAPVYSPTQYSPPRVRTGRPDGEPCEHIGCVRLRDKRAAAESEDQLEATG